MEHRRESIKISDSMKTYWKQQLKRTRKTWHDWVQRNLLTIGGQISEDTAMNSDVWEEMIVEWNDLQDRPVLS